MADLPEGAMRAWRDDVYVGAHPMRKPQTDTTVLWESVHRMDGMRYADVAWLWRGKGGWLVSTVRALGRVGKEPMAVPYLDSLFREFGSDLSVPPAKRVVYVDFGQSRTNGCLKLLTDGKGRLVIATFSPDRKNYAANEPDKVYAVIKTLLNNLGAKTSVPAAQSSFEQVDLRPLANCCSWRKPGAEKLWIRSGDVDYRYFPVNRCGWSLVARNFCPVEEFPSTPLCYDGAWDCPPAERDPNLWKNPRAFVYHWFLENPEPDKPIDAITLTDACRLGLFAITIEK